MTGKNAILTSALVLVAAVNVICAPLASADPNTLIAAKSSSQQVTDPVVTMNTTKGVIKIKLYKKEAPITAGNFIDLVNRKFYDGVVFHRYEPGFVVQGGDPTGTGTGFFEDPQTHNARRIKLEKSPQLKHDDAGMVAMARSSDPNSASSQFYFTLAPAPFLDEPPGYAVFGKVIDGMDVVQKLRKGDKMTKVTVSQ